MPEQSSLRGERPYWVLPVVVTVVIVLALFAVLAAFDGEWNVVWGDAALIALIVICTRSAN